MSGGGGGGGGFGFFKLNLTGIPVPFPTPKPVSELGSGEPFAYTVVSGDTCQSIAYAFGVSTEEIIAANNMPADCSTLTIGQVLNIPAPASLSTETVEGLRGMINVTIYKQANGSQRVGYGFMGATDPYPYYLLQGENLEELQAYQNRPVDVWGTVEYKEEGAILTVERYEIPFPDLQFQILRGSQSLTTLEGQPAALFTTDDGQTYVQFYPGGGVDGNLMSKPGDAMLIEALLIPGETFGGYPVVRAYGASMAVNPKNGEAAELQITASQINVIDETVEPEFTPPTLTIERVMLVYYMPDPIFVTGEFQPDQRYIQPAWLFIGHYSNGSEFFFLVQALQRPFLLPEPAPLTQPG
ncbi:MAG: LysM peptidoglycan-binding domain-containing protein [Chloroflexi bacterium]|nr:LysM peptidoglycan-binding domain-containing protein [Chloroflexota bacterium]